MFELKVTPDTILTFAGLVLNFAGLIFVAVQMRDGNRQRKMDSHIRLYDINRELLSLGFSKPELFEILKNDGHKVDPTLMRRYLQLWLNQLCLVDAFKRSGVFEKDVGESFDTDLRDMMLLPNMRHHWKKFGKYYPASFQETVNAILSEAGHGTAAEAAEQPMR